MLEPAQLFAAQPIVLQTKKYLSKIDRYSLAESGGFITDTAKPKHVHWIPFWLMKITSTSVCNVHCIVGYVKEFEH